MRPDRLELARLAFARALTLARARSTRASWARLLAAARNLDAARRERGLGGRRRGEALPPASDREPRPGRVLPLLLAASSARGEPAVVETAPVRVPAPAPAPAPAREGRGRWPELAAQLARSRALVDRSRSLCREAARLRAALLAFVAMRADVDPGS